MKIAFLHALPFDERMWESQLVAFSADHEVHAPTLYGLGSSCDEWALGVLQAVPGRFVAVGASMGGYTASAIARLAPERLQAIVLVGSRADADPPERAPLRAEWIRIVREQGGEGLRKAQAKDFFAPGTPPEIVKTLRAGVAKALHDPEFNSEFKKLMASDPSPLTGEQVETAIRELPRDPEIVGLYKKMADQGPIPERK